MTKELRQKAKTQLALAIAQGRSVALWARDNQVPRSTAYRWASQPELRATVESCRRRARDRALGRMAMQAQRASEQIVKLAAGAESESVKLRALRAILAGVISVAKFSDLRRRMAAIEQQLHERTDNTESVVLSDAMFTSGHTLEKPHKRATLSHFFSGERPLSGRRSSSTSRSAVETFDRERPVSASQKASWRTCTGQRPAVSAGVHYLPVSLSCATRRARPGRLTSPRGVPCPRQKSRPAAGWRQPDDSPAVHAVEGGFPDKQPPASGRRVAQLPGRSHRWTGPPELGIVNVRGRMI